MAESPSQVELDGITSSSSSPSNDCVIIVLATAERLEDVDPTVSRPGRLGTHLFLPNPRTQTEAAEVMVAASLSVPLDLSSSSSSSGATTRLEFFERVVEKVIKVEKPHVYPTRAELANFVKGAVLFGMKRALGKDAGGTNVADCATTTVPYEWFEAYGKGVEPDISVNE